MTKHQRLIGWSPLDIPDARAGLTDAHEQRPEVAHDRWRSLAVPLRIHRARHEPPAPVPPTPTALDGELRRLLRVRGDRHGHFAERLLAFRDLAGPVWLGFRSLAHYGREALGLSDRLVQEIERVGTGLEGLPAIAAARARGEISWTKLRLITSVARPATEEASLRRARVCTVRYLEREIRAAHRRRESDPAGWRRDGEPGDLHHEPPYGERSPVRPGAALWGDAHASAPDEDGTASYCLPLPRRVGRGVQPRHPLREAPPAAVARPRHDLRFRPRRRLPRVEPPCRHVPRGRAGRSSCCAAAPESPILSRCPAMM